MTDLFELELRRAGRVLSRAQCWAIAQQLMMESKQVMDTALQFFHSAHLMLYYKDVLEDVVFVDPMAVFDWITAILEKSIEIKDAVEQEVATVDLLRLKHQALVPTSFLESLQSEVTGEDSVLVNVDDFINKHLMIFATVEEDDKSTKYFMPSILDYREGKDIVRPIILSQTAPYLVIKFEIKTVPSAVLSSLEVYLRSCEGNIQWQIPVHHSKQTAPLYKNDMHFTATLSGGIGRGFTLVGLSTHYEVHADSKCSPELLPLIWEDIQHEIDYICNRFSFDLPYSIGFRYLCERTGVHPAIPSVDSKSWVCSEDETVTGTLSDKQKLWLRNESQSKVCFSMNELLCCGKRTFLPQCVHCVYASASRMHEGHTYNVIIIGSEQSANAFYRSNLQMFSLRNSNFVPKRGSFFAIRYLCATFVNSWTFIAFCHVPYIA